MVTDLKYAEITEKIIGCAMTVHRKMKAGYSELIYARCLAIEFDKIHLPYQKEADLTDKELNQALNYLENHRKEVGLLINFGAKSLQFKRLINSKVNPAIINPTNPSNPRL